MSKNSQCIFHARLSEIYCLTCNSFLCPECIGEHADSKHEPKYIHASVYAQQFTYPKIDTLIESTEKNKTKLNDEVLEFTTILTKHIPEAKAKIEEYIKTVNALKGILTEISGYSTAILESDYAEKIKHGLANDKKALENAIKNKDLSAIVSISRRVEAEEKLSSGVTTGTLASDLTKGLVILSDAKSHEKLLDTLQLIMFKGQQLKLYSYIGQWRIDSKYVSTKMTLSDNGLIYGNKASSGYVAIIGDTLLVNCKVAFGVIPRGLCCNGKEGFGIIEYDTYERIYKGDKTTPTAYDNMVGFLYNNVAKNMTAEQMTNMQMGEKYTVKVDLIEHTMSITGNNLKLTTKLKPDTIYVPCFSCGCSNNKIEVTPLESYDSTFI